MLIRPGPDKKTGAPGQMKGDGLRPGESGIADKVSALGDLGRDPRHLREIEFALVMDPWHVLALPFPIGWDGLWRIVHSDQHTGLVDFDFAEFENAIPGALRRGAAGNGPGAGRIGGNRERLMDIR